VLISDRNRDPTVENGGDEAVAQLHLEVPAEIWLRHPLIHGTEISPVYDMADPGHSTMVRSAVVVTRQKRWYEAVSSLSRVC